MADSRAAPGADTLVGSDVGKFRVLARIGAGGMGVVYRAEDTSLGRTVALKVLPPDKTADPVRKKRMLREARSLAALDHRSIATVYEVGEAGGVAYIAMELIDGQSLKERLRRGALAAWEAVPIFVAVADALEHAHRNGVVHRDLKPSNVMLTASGGVKLLDFGIAKLLESAPREAEAPTTHEGQVLGTPEYMSPEQARGDRTDHRSDIFSLGSLMYAAVSGRPPFDEETPHETIVAVYRRTPPHLDEVAPEVPSDLRHLIHRCLRKDPDRRYQQAAAVKADLETLAVDQTMTAATSSATSGPRTAPSAPAARSRRWLLGAAAFAGCLALAAAGYWLTRGVGGGAARVDQVETPAWGEVQAEYRERRLTSNSAGFVPVASALSDDGKLLAYTTRLGVWLRRLPDGRDQEIRFPHLGGENALAFSPDGRHVLMSGRGVSGRGEVWKAPVAGGEAVQVYAGEPMFGLDVSPDGKTLLLSGRGVVRAYELGSSRPPTTLFTAAAAVASARWSPDGESVACMIVDAARVRIDARGEIWVASRDGSGTRRVAKRSGLHNYGIGGVVWLDSSTLGFVEAVGNRTKLFAIDLEAKEAEPVLLHEWSDGIIHIDKVLNGAVVYRKLSFDNATGIVSLRPDGGFGPIYPVTTRARGSYVHSWTRNGSIVLTEALGGAPFLSIVDPANGETARIEDVVRTRPAAATETGLYFWREGGHNAVELHFKSLATGKEKKIWTARPDAVPQISCARGREHYCLVSELRNEWMAYRELGADHEVSAVRWTHEFTGDENWALSPDGTRLAYLAPDQRASVLDLRSGRVAAWRVETNGVMQRLYWADDEALLILLARVSVSTNGAVVRTKPGGETSLVWTAPSNIMRTLAVSPDNRRVATTTSEWEMDVWLLEPASDSARD